MQNRVQDACPEAKDNEEQPGSGRFAELEELRLDIARRIRDNQRFLERFLEEDFVEEEGSEEPLEEDEL